MEMGRRLLNDRYLQAAVSQVELRAEYQQDIEHLADTFVDPGVAVQLANDNSQIVYGRRGTGKTHLLKVIQRQLQDRDHIGRLAVYIDMRKLGSSSIFENPERPMSARVGGLLRDVLELIHSSLLSQATDPDTIVSAHALNNLDLFGHAIVRTVVKDPVARIQESIEQANSNKRSLNLTVSATPHLDASLSSQSDQKTQSSSEVSGAPVPVLFFNEITETINNVLESCGIDHLTVLFDEWNHIPIDLQPMLAEFLRKALLCLPQISVKIATLEYRTNFREARDAYNNIIGFELGADVSTALELDEYYVYYDRKSKVPDHFAELLFRHLSTEVDRQSRVANYLEQRYGIADHDQLVDALFVGRKTFLELVRAGEGVARDFINVFSKAFFGAVREEQPGIAASSIRDAAGDWYELEKALNIQEREEQALGIICEQVIARNGTVNFLISRKQERCALIRALVDLRLMHLLKRGYRPDSRNPTSRYNIYALDYGTYAHLLGTADAPQLVTVEQMRSQRQPLILLDELVTRLDSAVGPFRNIAEYQPVLVEAR